VPVTVSALTPRRPSRSSRPQRADFERGETVGVTARAADAIGVARHAHGGTATFSETRQIVPAAPSTDATFSFAILRRGDRQHGDADAARRDTGGNLSALATRAHRR
jgi:hypothetical protein